MNAQTLTGGQAVVECIRREGVRHVFCVPGESYLAVLDAFNDAPEMQLIVNRQEGGACFMAEAYAKATRRPGVVLVTRGPGATNASIGVHAAQQDSTPLVVFIGQVPRARRGLESFQEVDYRQFFGSMAKWVVEIEQAAEVPRVVRRAFHLARSGRPGPVVVSLPEDMLVESAPCHLTAPDEVRPPHPQPAAVARWVNAVNAAQRPLLIVGAGVQYGAAGGARQELIAFSEHFQVPVLTGFRRMDAFPNDHAHYLGNLGLGKSPAQDVVREADLVIALGTRLPEITTAEYTLPTPGQRLIQIDISEAEIGKVFPTELGLVADAALALRAALEQVALKQAAQPSPDPQQATATAETEATAEAAATKHRTRTAWIAKHRQIHQEYITPRVRDVPGVPMEHVLQNFNAVLPADAIFTVDAGNFSGWIHRYRPFAAADSFFGPTLGSMGYGLPAAIGAKLAHPQRVVIGNCGDGGFMMTLQELATAVQYGVNIIQVVYNNGSYGTIRMHQEREFPGRPIGTDLQNPNFAALAETMGALGLRVDAPEAFRPALEQALAADRPALIEVITDLENLSVGATLSQIRSHQIQSP